MWGQCVRVHCSPCLSKGDDDDVNEDVVQVEWKFSYMCEPLKRFFIENSCYLCGAHAAAHGARKVFPTRVVCRATELLSVCDCAAASLWQLRRLRNGPKNITKKKKKNNKLCRMPQNGVDSIEVIDLYELFLTYHEVGSVCESMCGGRLIKGCLADA